MRNRFLDDTITEREREQVDARMRPRRRRWSSSMGCGCCRELGQLGRAVRGGRVRRADAGLAG